MHRYVAIYRKLEMKELPLLTELKVKLSDLVSPPEGMLVVAFVGLIMVVLGVSGRLDAALLPLIIANGSLIVFLLVGWLIGPKLPRLRIQDALSG